MINSEDQQLLADAVALSEQNDAGSPFDKGYGAAMRAVLILLTNRSNAQRYNIGRDSVVSFRNRQAKAIRRGQ